MRRLPRSEPWPARANGRAACRRGPARRNQPETPPRGALPCLDARAPGRTRRCGGVRLLVEGPRPGALRAPRHGARRPVALRDATEHPESAPRAAAGRGGGPAKPGPDARQATPLATMPEAEPRSPPMRVRPHHTMGCGWQRNCTSLMRCSPPPYDGLRPSPGAAAQRPRRTCGSSPAVGGRRRGPRRNPGWPARSRVGSAQPLTRRNHRACPGRPRRRAGGPTRARTVSQALRGRGTVRSCQDGRAGIALMHPAGRLGREPRLT